jgi:protein-tyrosine phosphatase
VLVESQVDYRRIEMPMHIDNAKMEDRTPPPHGLIFDGDEAIDEAEDWLNDNVAEDGSVFHFANGSFYYELLSEIEEQ